METDNSDLHNKDNVVYKTPDYILRARKNYYNNKIKHNKEFMEKQRIKHNETYHAKKNDEEFMRKKREAQKRYYEKKKLLNKESIDT
jgi:hypothetical protein